jgi:peptidoglycan/LPS O-acetylase OafA/YrhL
VRYNPSLDGLRAVAALAVLVHHVHGPWLPGGFIGVDVFFVLSGFLITALLRDEAERTSRIAVGRFYWRRLLRLWPALLVMLAAYVALAPVVLGDQHAVRGASLAALYLSDYALAHWDVQLEGLSHCWSLAAEWKFYLIWPLVILATARIPSGRLAVILVGLFVVATAWRYADQAIFDNWSRTYYRLDTHISGLVLGSAIAVATPRLPAIAAAIVGGVGLAMLAAAALVLHTRTTLPLTSGGVWIDLASAMIVMALAGNEKSPFGRMLAFGPLVYLGLISYSIYLWHYPIALYAKENFEPGAALAIALAFSIALASLSYHLVEKPFRIRRRVLGREVATSAQKP